ncbi:MAG TPA: 3-deoxy-D-manno-octulosonic acid transferase [Acetobacteraceae bacterium]|jgi:3-deoxy-D-manno-octulosonic-acid transferase
MLRSIYAAAIQLAAPVLRLMLARRVRRGREIASRLGEREGIEVSPRPEGPLLWMHAASVGESVAVLPVLSALAACMPEATVLMTTGTVTSAAMLDRRLPELGLQGRVIHRFVPLDVPSWVGRFLDHWRPDVVAFVESEIWPNLLAGCAARGIPMMMVNARLSAGSFARWRKVPALARELFGGFAWIQAQSEGDAARIEALGGRASALAGNLKFAADQLPADADELARLREVLAGRPVWVASSTHPGEDTAVLEAHAAVLRAHPGLVTIGVPRHPQRGADIAAKAGSVPVTRRALGQDPPAVAGLWVVDTLGELGLVYRLGAPVFVGRSLGESGGQNPLEPARLGCAVAVGPNTANFADIVTVLEAAGGLARVADAAGLAAWVSAMLDDPVRRTAMGQRALAASRRYGDLPGQVAAAIAAMLAPACVP